MRPPAQPAPDSSAAEVVPIRPDREVMTRQKLPAFVGISASTAGASGICMNVVEIPPGGAAAPHLHRGFETAIYLLAGSVETHYGPGLRRSVVSTTGDFLYIPPDVPHQPVNLSDTEPALAVVARNTGEEQESVVAYDAGAETAAGANPDPEPRRDPDPGRDAHVRRS